jgi:hypothetical protein
MELCLGMGLSTAGKSFQICEDYRELELGASVYMQQGFGGEQ